MTPFIGPQLALCVASQTVEKQGHHQVSHASPKTLSTVTSTGLICGFVKNVFLLFQRLAGPFVSPLNDPPDLQSDVITFSFEASAFYAMKSSGNTVVDVIGID